MSRLTVVESPCEFWGFCSLPGALTQEKGERVSLLTRVLFGPELGYRYCHELMSLFAS